MRCKTMTNERPNLKQIRIKKSVCDRLDERKAPDDSYTDVIKALLDENDRLLERNIQLERDKADITAIAKALTFDKLIEEGAIEMNVFEEALNEFSFERTQKD